jgi:hypothetical protein
VDVVTPPLPQQLSSVELRRIIECQAALIKKLDAASGTVLGALANIRDEAGERDPDLGYIDDQARAGIHALTREQT